MTLDQRIADVEQRFNTKQVERDNLIKQSEECSTEMTKLQGEWRLLHQLKEQSEPKTSDQEPTVEVVDEGKSKKASN